MVHIVSCDAQSSHHIHLPSHSAKVRSKGFVEMGNKGIGCYLMEGVPSLVELELGCVGGVWV